MCPSLIPSPSFFLLRLGTILYVFVQEIQPCIVEPLSPKTDSDLHSGESVHTHPVQPRERLLRTRRRYKTHAPRARTRLLGSSTDIRPPSTTRPTSTGCKVSTTSAFATVISFAFRGTIMPFRMCAALTSTLFCTGEYLVLCRTIEMNLNM